MITKLSQNEDFTIVTKGGGRIVAPNIVAEPQFNPTAAYAKDAKVWYGSISYICTSATTSPEEGHSNPTPEEDTAHWSALPVEEMAKKSEVDPLLFAQYYPDGSVKSAAEFRDDIKYNLNDSNHTATVKTFCNTGTTENDNSNLKGRVVIPPFVDASGNGYISDDGTRYKVVGVGSGTDSNNSNENLTAVIAPSTVANIKDKAFRRCTKLASVSIPAATSIGSGAFNTCSSLVSVSLPAATSIGTYAFNACTKLVSVSLPAVTRIDSWAFYNCTSLASVSLPVVTRVDGHVFDGCIKLVSVSLPVATTIGGCAFYNCTSLASVSLPAAFSVDGYTFYNCTSLESVDFGATLSSVSTLGSNAFNNVPTTCKIIVPDSQYNAWTAANRWRDLVTQGYKFLRHSDWEYIRRYEIVPLLFAQYYPDGSVKSEADFTAGIKYAAPDTTNRTIMVSPFCVTPWTGYDNSSLVGRVVIPPFVDAQFNPYISDDGTRYRVVGVGIAGLEYSVGSQDALTAVVAPNTVTSIRDCSFDHCTSLTSVSLPAATTIGGDAFHACTSLISVDFGDTPRSSVPSLGANSFNGVPTSCKIIVPDAQYDAWTAETLPDESPNPWYDLVTAGYKFLKHSEWEYARKYELDAKLDKSSLSDALLGVPTGNYANMDAIADRLDMLIKAFKGIAGPSPRTFYLQSVEGASTVSMRAVGSPSNTVALEYSLGDSGVWQEFVIGTTSVPLAQGEFVRFRAGTNGNTQIAQNINNYRKFVLTGKVAAGGNIMSLLYHDEADANAATTFPTGGTSQFAKLFYDNSTPVSSRALVDVSALVLPAMTLADSCYYSMFDGCTSLTAAPVLPATTLANNCYQTMFQGCTSLTAAPVLPATTLANNCYLAMFQFCTSLVAAPALPATTLANQCYLAMFQGCTSLVAAPALPATTLTDSCYYYMFHGCTSLVAAPALPATTLARGCYGHMFEGCTLLVSVAADFEDFKDSVTHTNATDSWLNGVSATGTFHCKSALTIPERGASTVPSGWTVVTDR